MRSLTAVMATALVLLPAAPAWAAGQAPVAVDDAVNIRSYAGVAYAVNAAGQRHRPGRRRARRTPPSRSATKGQRLHCEAGSCSYAALPRQLGNGLLHVHRQRRPGEHRDRHGDGHPLAGPPRSHRPRDQQRGAPGSATLSWPAATDAVQYQVFRNTVLVHTTSARTWTDTGLQADRQYEYRIAAVNGGGWGGGAVCGGLPLPAGVDTRGPGA